ncbi:hypothetical protein SERLA73DRAFT_184185 [Serpula lacrymans var. lacrymans S7.3]|uniref:Uncharacterized protein n=2 Tax=Serpula lacrymans var. lacrymans TaxID=341189 RepID=F8Q2Q6_SERL3|nr:uncharacterized protein SERLADRAFT_471738 [Serpula lacrymans var. lacrymans S7.9]EGN97467.1 hypothetical protein SERLA73DRAFT_184185 [Serpula lacrymans var. lacrymans S7.3]EGO23060.1 hypothetical protein SERLADRAFT_471738 [Serpula lacrymans var. lacrymans S7.9]
MVLETAKWTPMSSAEELEGSSTRIAMTDLQEQTTGEEYCCAPSQTDAGSEVSSTQNHDDADMSIVPSSESEQDRDPEPLTKHIPHDGADMKLTDETESQVDLASALMTAEKDNIIQELHEEIDLLRQRNTELTLQSKQQKESSRMRKQGIQDQEFNHVINEIPDTDIQGLLSDLSEVIDHMVSEVIDIVASLHQITKHQSEPPPPIDTLLWALKQDPLVTGARQYLLDAYMHSSVNNHIHQLFFQPLVAPFIPCDTSPEVASTTSEAILEVQMLDHLFEKLLRTEPWHIAQRWRAITASHVPRQIPDPLAFLAEYTPQEEYMLYGIIFQLYSVDNIAREKLSTCLSTKMKAIYNQAYHLSVTIKCDVLPTRLLVTKCNEDVVNPRIHNIWPLDTKDAGGKVLGTYHLGLVKQVDNDKVSVLTAPTVVSGGFLHKLGLHLHRRCPGPW